MPTIGGIIHYLNDNSAIISMTDYFITLILTSNMCCKIKLPKLPALHIFNPSLPRLSLSLPASWSRRNRLANFILFFHIDVTIRNFVGVPLHSNWLPIPENENFIINHYEKHLAWVLPGRVFARVRNPRDGDRHLVGHRRFAEAFDDIQERVEFDAVPIGVARGKWVVHWYPAIRGLSYIMSSSEGEGGSW